MKDLLKNRGVLERVGPNLYRHSITKKYSGLVKVGRRQKKKAFKTTDPQIAKRRLAEFRERVQRLHGSEDRNIRFAELAQAWLESIEAELKPSSFKRRETSVRSLEGYFKDMAMRSIGFVHVENWKKKRGGEVAAQTFNIDRETLGLIFQYGIDRHILLDNPISKVKRRKVVHKKALTFSEEQFKQLITDLKASPRSVYTGAADMIEFLGESGLRVGEAREICVKDVNLESGSIRITGGETGTKNHKERFLPVFDDLLPSLTRILEKRATLGPSTRLFAIKTPRKALDLACARLNLGDFNVHSLRHYFASNAVQRGINFKRIADWLAHSDGGILVGKTYGHLRRESEDDDVAKMRSKPNIG